MYNNLSSNNFLQGRGSTENFFPNFRGCTADNPNIAKGKSDLMYKRFESFRIFWLVVNIEETMYTIGNSNSADKGETNVQI